MRNSKGSPGLKVVLAAALLVMVSSANHPAFADCTTEERSCDHLTPGYAECSPARSANEEYALGEILKGKQVDFHDRYQRLSGCFIRFLLTDHNLKIPASGIVIIGATIDGQVDLENLEVVHRVELKNCLFKNAVNLRRSHFSKGLSFEHSQFAEQYEDSSWLIAEFATIDFDFNLDDTLFKNHCIRFNGVRVANTWSLRRASFAGVADFTGANVGGTLMANGATFHGSADFQSLKTELDASFENTTFDCFAFFGNLQANSLVVRKATFGNDVNFDGAKLENFYLGSGTEAAHFTKTKALSINDMTFAYMSPEDWTELSKVAEDLNDPNGRYNAQFYASVENLLSKHGRADQADAVYVAGKNKEWATLSWYYKIYRFFDWILVGYGRYKELLLFWSIVFVLIGWRVFRSEADMVRRKPEEFQSYPYRYRGFWYSLDLFVPVIGLGEAATWIPRKGFRVWYRRLHIILGHLLIPIGLAALAGLIK